MIINLYKHGKESYPLYLKYIQKIFYKKQIIYKPKDYFIRVKTGHYKKYIDNKIFDENIKINILNMIYKMENKLMR